MFINQIGISNFYEKYVDTLPRNYSALGVNVRRLNSLNYIVHGFFLHD